MRYPNSPLVLLVFILVDIITITLLAPISTDGSAGSCALMANPPKLTLVHSEALGYEPQVGEQLVIATVYSNDCARPDVPFVGILEVRNSEGITEYLAWQTGILEYHQSIQIGYSWMPEYADTYELRTFIISDLPNPRILSPVSTSDAIIVPSLPNHNTEPVITLERTACLGSCPVYSLVIFEDGTVYYEGPRYVAVTGDIESKIPEADVVALLEKSEEIGYFSLQDSYSAGVTDLPTTITSVTIGNLTKKIIDNYGAPEKLREFEQLIDALANTAQWVDCPDGEPIGFRKGC